MRTARLCTDPAAHEGTLAGAITQDPNAAMRWPNYWSSIVVKYRVVVEGWPHDEVPFRNLSDVSNLQKLDLLLRGWQSGTIYFRRVSEGEFAVLEAARAAMIEDIQRQEANSVNLELFDWE